MNIRQSGSIDSYSFNCSSRWNEWPASLSGRITPGETTRVALWTGCREDRSEHCMEKKNLLPLLGIESSFFGRPAPCLVTVPTEVFGVGRTHVHTHRVGEYITTVSD
jgi:hypothetical protein